MKKILVYFRFLVAALNIGVSILLLFCAYSPYIDPKAHPLLACAGMAFPLFLVVQLLFCIYWLLFCRRQVVIPVVSLLLCAGAIRTYIPFNLDASLPSERKDCIKILSYNTMAFANGIRHTKEAPNPVLEYLVESDADIICMQEYTVDRSPSQLRKKDVEYALRKYPYRKQIPIGIKDNGLACFSRYPILSQQKLEYQSKYNGSVMYELLIDGDTVAVLNNHLESNKLTLEDRNAYRDIINSPDKQNVGQGVRQLSSKLLEAMSIRASQVDRIAHVVDSLQRIGRTTILCGDFNDTPISYTHHRLTEHLHSAFVESGNGLGVSYNQNGFYFRIDNILISKDLRSYQCKVDNRLKASDHYPIACFIEKKK